VDVKVISLGEELGVKTYIVNPPLICTSPFPLPKKMLTDLDGTGSGPLNQHSLQIPLLLKISAAEGRALVIGDGKGVSADIICCVRVVADYFPDMESRSH
jgi:hypothetical protein